MNENEHIELENITEDELTTFEQIKNWPMAYYLVAINVIVFIALHLSNSFIEPNYIINNFAKNIYGIAYDGQFYRLFTAIFIHESVTHLLFNCMAIIILGKPVEMIFGKNKFLIIFLVSGLFGSLTSFIFSVNTSIGASGGVFGMFGVHIYLFLRDKDKYLKVFGYDMFKLLALNVIIGFMLPAIDFWGHFGGILGGLLATFTLGLYHQYKLNKHMVIGLLVTVILFAGSFVLSYNNYNQLYEEIEVYTSQIDEGLARQDINLIISGRDALGKGHLKLMNSDYILYIDQIIEQNK